MTLPTNIDATYANTGDASRALHQQHHDEIHAFVNDHPGEVNPHPQYQSVTATQVAEVATAEGTTTTTFVDLATVGPAVTVTVGASGRALVIIGAQQSNSNAGAYAIMGFAVSGASTLAADAAGLADAPWQVQSATASNELSGSRACVVTGLTPGSNIFTAKYRAAAAGTATFANRQIIVMPL